jgi:hypothetical protein
MKRKIIPFPSAAVCSMRTTATRSSLTSRTSESKKLLSSELPAIEASLDTSQFHEFSVSLLSSDALYELESNKPEGLLSWKVLQAGLIEVSIQSGKPDGYGARAWQFRIGGVGLIYNELAAPIAVRCALPIAHCHIDDAGFVDATFWKDDKSDLISNLSVSNIVRRLVLILSVNYCTSLDGIMRRRWEESEVHCYQKVSTIVTYRSSALCPFLVGEASAFNHDWLASSLREIPSSEWCKSAEEVSPGVFSFDLFSPEFCDLLVAEVDNYEATTLPRRRPNTMNKFGLILNEIGLEPVMSDLLAAFVGPLCGDLYPLENVSKGLDHHHTFVVVYNQTGDKGLDMHHDASEVTLNVCLGRDFTGSGLVFCGHAGRADHRKHRHLYSHKKGRAVIHLGRQRHGADSISSGERMNLIMWARSSAFRCAAVNGTVLPEGFPRLAEDGMPDRLCLSLANDEDYAQQLQRITEEALTAQSVVA